MGIEESRATPFVILIAPNVSERMGGEAIKALQIYQSLVDRGVEVHQVTHSRVRDEITANFPEMKASYVEDDRLDVFLAKSKALEFFSTPYFMWRAAKVARELAREHPGAVVHVTSPISPVAPTFPVPGTPVVIGPLNGNIHHPRPFRDRESPKDRIRRTWLVPSQRLHRLFFSGKQTADVLLVAGGERTAESLRIAGCRDAQFRPTLDSGLPDKIRHEPLIEHSGPNFRFVQHGRLVPYKGADLSIKALARTRNPATLDIIGQGAFQEHLEKLVAELKLGDRVRFFGWTPHDKLLKDLRQYRAFVFPTLAEANGIVVQEAMMLGLPTICVDWGGPAELITPETGILLPPSDEESVVAGLAAAMDKLGEDGELAARMAEAGRRAALERGFTWPDLIEQWIAIYRELRPPTATAPAHAGGHPAATA